MGIVRGLQEEGEGKVSERRRNARGKRQDNWEAGFEGRDEGNR